MRVVYLLFTLLLLPVLGHAQDGGRWDAEKMQLSRESLQELLARYEETAQSTAYSAELRRQATDEMALLQARLENGDFQTGDQISLQVEGEEQLSGDFVVRAGQVLTLPVVGDVPLKGVLRSELRSHLTSFLGRYLRHPVIHTRTSFRVTIAGAVGKPGFYVVPSEILLSDVLMVAGGPAPRADLEKIWVERGSKRIWEGASVQRAITEGRTLDQLSLRAGDQIVVPTAMLSKGERFSYREVLTVVAGLGGLIGFVVNLF